jgi:hypothetical protein
MINGSRLLNWRLLSFGQSTYSTAIKDLAMKDAEFKELYKSTRIMARHANLVVAHLASKIGFENACVRVVEHLSVVLQDAFERADPEEMAFALVDSHPSNTSS